MIFLFLVLAALAVGAGIYFLAKFLSGRRLRSSLKMVLLSVKVHKEIVENTAAKDFKQEINLTEQLLSGLASLKKSFVLEIAVPHIGEEIHFYLSVPRLVKEVATKQIQGIWANASVEEADDDYNIFNPSGATAGAYLKQGENYALPIRTYQEIGMDTFSAIIGGFSKMNEVGEGAALQIVVRPAAKESKKRFESYLRSLKRGEPLKRVFGHTFPFGHEEMKEAFNPKGEEANKEE